MNNIPAQLAAGDSVSWKTSATQDNLGNRLTSAIWILTYYFNGATAFSKAAVTDGDGWQTTLAISDTATLAAGDYYWQAKLADGAGNIITVGTGKLQILPNLSGAPSGVEMRSQAKKDLDAVQGAIRAIIAGGAVQRYQVAGRELWKLPMTELLMLESKLKAEVVREQKADKIRNGLGDPNNLYVRLK